MKQHIMYISHDDQTFVDRFACARHELESQPELLAKLNEKMSKFHISQQGNWCGGDPDTRSYSSACACMGCANHYFYDLGLEYAHWKVWFEELRGEQPNDSIPDTNTDVDVILVDVGDARIAVFKAIRSATGLGIVETKNLMDRGPGVAIKSEVSFYEGKHLMDELQQLGATVRLIVSGKQRWTILKTTEYKSGF